MPPVAGPREPGKTALGTPELGLRRFVPSVPATPEFGTLTRAESAAFAPALPGEAASEVAGAGDLDAMARFAMALGMAEGAAAFAAELAVELAVVPAAAPAADDARDDDGIPRVGVMFGRGTSTETGPLEKMPEKLSRKPPQSDAESVAPALLEPATTAVASPRWFAKLAAIGGAACAAASGEAKCAPRRSAPGGVACPDGAAPRPPVASALSSSSGSTTGPGGPITAGPLVAGPPASPFLPSTPLVHVSQPSIGS